MIDDINIYGYFFGGFFAVSPLVLILGIFKGIKVAMWASALDTP